MSRSGYMDDCGFDGPEEQWAHICYRGAVQSALRGKRGQAALREALAALDAMPVKELAKDSLQTEQGSVCTLGALGTVRGLDIMKLDPENWDAVAAAFGIAPAMVREIVFENDENNILDRWDAAHNCWIRESPAQRWQRMRAWIAGQIREVVPA